MNTIRKIIIRKLKKNNISITVINLTRIDDLSKKNSYIFIFIVIAENSLSFHSLIFNEFMNETEKIINC